MRALHGDAVAWGPVEHLLAAVFDAVSISNWQRASIYSKTKPPKWKPLLRPGENDPRRLGGRSGLAPAQMKSLLELWRDGALEMVDTTTEVR